MKHLKSGRDSARTNKEAAALKETLVTGITGITNGAIGYPCLPEKISWYQAQPASL